MQKQEYSRRVGEDRILRSGEQLVVCSKVDMEEWEVRQNRKTAIFVDEEPWCLVGRQYTASKEVHYLLEPWTEYLKQIPGRKIRYDAEYVRARDLAERKRKIENGVGPLLFHLRGLIGFVPSPLKTCIEENFGVPARNATFISMIIELFLFFGAGAMLQVFAYGAMRAPLLVYAVPSLLSLTIVIFVDLVMRYDSYCREDASPWGTLEWLFHLHRTGVLLKKLEARPSRPRGPRA